MLLDAGAVLVGKMKVLLFSQPQSVGTVLVDQWQTSQFANGEIATADW